MGAATDEELDAIADLPKSYRPALTFTSAQTIAEHAAREGIVAQRANRHEDALKRVAAVVDRALPAHDHDETPDAWVRRGLHRGVMDHWRGLIYIVPETDAASQQLHAAGHTLGWATSARLVMESS